MEKLLLVLPYFSHAIKILRLMFLLLISEDLCAQSTGTLIVSPKPKEAEIQLFRDTTLVAEWMGKKRFKELPVGSYTIKANYFGFLPFKEPFEIVEGKKRRMRVKLQIADFDFLNERARLMVSDMEEPLEEGQTLPEIIHGTAGYMGYPAEARMDGAEGILVLRITVDVYGKAKKVEVVQGVHPLCDEAAIRSVSSASYKPGTDDGVPVVRSFLLPIVFKLALY